VGSDALLRDVSDTAVLVAVQRAIESERPHPLFRDPYARRLAGERGERLAREVRGAGLNWPVVVRTLAIDELLLRTVERDGAACVLNLAAGLDSRPYRLDLPPGLRWVEADLPAILDHKAERLAGERPRCRLERVPADLTDPASRGRLLEAVGDAPALVLTEGLLAYLSADEVTSLGRDLGGHPAPRWWLMDLGGPLFVEWGNRGRVGRQLAQANSTFRFGPEEGPDFPAPGLGAVGRPVDVGRGAAAGPGAPPDAGGLGAGPGAPAGALPGPAAHRPAQARSRRLTTAAARTAAATR
jgi:methyltransferase (TIGR00027 family)